MKKKPQAKRSKGKKIKYIFIIGGVMSGIGKGVTTSSFATILSFYGYKVNLMKIDPYLNVDAGTMHPTEHGECFVLSSGLECDQDMGNYERFLGRNLSNNEYMTGGMVYQEVINRERSLKYKGKCVESIPHIADEIKRRIVKSATMSGADIQIVEIGGTAGDYQNIIFLESLRSLKAENPQDVFSTLVSYVPLPDKIGEMKTRPTQNAIHALNSSGIIPSFIIARSNVPLDKKRKEKIAGASSLSQKHVISAPDIDSIYDIPINLEKENVGKLLIEELGLPKKKRNNKFNDWKKFASKNNSLKKLKDVVNIAIVGKYFDTGDFTLRDSYISIIESINFSAVSKNANVKITWLDSKKYEGKSGVKRLKDFDKFDGVLIPGGFGSTGVEGKINVISYLRKNKIPFLGICYGMQLAIVEFMRNVVGKKGANTIEVDPKTKIDVITIMDEQVDLIRNKNYGGTMRLGEYKSNVKKGSLIHNLYQTDTIYERHRHRYEVNIKYLKDLEKNGLKATVKTKNLVEAVELDGHPFFVGVQYHPEFISSPFDPSPIFDGFIAAAKKFSQK